MTASTRTRSRSRTSARTSAHRASGGLSPRVVPFLVAAGVALLVGVAAGFLLLKPAGTSASSGASGGPVVKPGTPASEVALPTAENPGPVRVANGVPSGFLRGQAGAIAAAGAFTRTAVQFAVQPPPVVAAASRAVVVNGADPNAGFVVPVEFIRSKIEVGTNATLQSVPVGFKVGALAADRATVNVWTAVFTANLSGTQTEGGVVPSLAEAAYFTTTVSLVYRNGDWRLSGIAVAEGPGVAPTPDNTLDPAALAEQMRGFTPFEYLPPQEVTQ